MKLQEKKNISRHTKHTHTFASLTYEHVEANAEENYFCCCEWWIMMNIIICVQFAVKHEILFFFALTLYCECVRVYVLLLFFLSLISFTYKLAILLRIDYAIIFSRSYVHYITQLMCIYIYLVFCERRLKAEYVWKYELKLVFVWMSV